jgi:hypothetical protein
MGTALYVWSKQSHCAVQMGKTIQIFSNTAGVRHGMCELAFSADDTWTICRVRVTLVKSTEREQVLRYSMNTPHMKQVTFIDIQSVH